QTPPADERLKPGAVIEMALPADDHPHAGAFVLVDAVDGDRNRDGVVAPRDVTQSDEAVEPGVGQGCRAGITRVDNPVAVDDLGYIIHLRGRAPVVGVHLRRPVTGGRLVIDDDLGGRDAGRGVGGDDVDGVNARLQVGIVQFDVEVAVSHQAAAVLADGQGL